VLAVSMPVLVTAQQLAYSVVGNPFAYWIPFSGLTPVFAFVIIVFAFNAGWLSRVLSAAPLVRLGELSFAVYLFHQILLRWLATDGASYLTRWPPAVVVGALWVVLLGLSYASWRWVEMPARRWIVTHAGGRVPVAQVVAPPRSTARIAARWAVLAVVVLSTGVAVERSGLLAAMLPADGRLCGPVEGATPSEPPPSLTQPIGFDRHVQLVAFQLIPASSGYQLRTRWRALTTDLTGWNIGLHAIDTAAKIHDIRGAVLAPTPQAIGGEWNVDIAINAAWLQSGTRVALALFRDQTLLAIDRGARDWGNRRLILALP
jgi:hypothetical protein